MSVANPFPGMNPYLEDPPLWGDVHHTLISVLRRQINRVLPEGYVALIQERVYVERNGVRQGYLPDVAVSVRSPTNKTQHSTGRRLYLRKQRDLLRSRTHLIEIDLLHAGTHTAFPPLEMLRRVRSSWDYLVCLHRAGWGGAEADVWFIDLPHPLPRIVVPLLPSDPDVEVHLQAALEETYLEGQYHQVIDYTAECPAPLPSAVREWVSHRLREQGWR